MGDTVRTLAQVLKLSVPTEVAKQAMQLLALLCRTDEGSKQLALLCRTDEGSKQLALLCRTDEGSKQLAFLSGR